MDAKLDALLHFVREPEPSDDTFVGATLASVRAHEERRTRRRRMLTRPAAAAVAAVVVLSGAVAAVVRIDDARQHEGAVDALHEHTQGVGPDEAAREHAPPPADVTPNELQFGEETDWGYADEHTAYAVDRETGLRLQTTVADTEIETGTPQTVTVSLVNTGERTVAVDAPRRCALLVGAYLANDGSRPSDEPAHPWQCTTTSDASSTQQDERFVLEPGDTLIGEATIALSAAGDWRLVGMCRCTFRAADEPAPKPDAGDPLDGLPPLVSAASPLLPPPDRTAEEGSTGLVTPPIRVRAR